MTAIVTSAASSQPPILSTNIEKLLQVPHKCIVICVPWQWFAKDMSRAPPSKGTLLIHHEGLASVP